MDEPMDIQNSPESEIGSVRLELARSFQKHEIMDLSLVLASQGIKHWLEFDGAALILTIEDIDGLPAKNLIEIYRTENHGYQDPTLTPGSLELFLAPLIFLAVPVVSYFGVEAMPWATWWHSRGRADAGAILSGEWWRCLTATTLHADDLHFLSNLVSGYFILNLLNHRLGMGTIMILASLGGALANLLVAVTTGPGHLSIGFSSVVFCALGLLASVETLYLPRRTERSLRRLTPLISAFFVAVLVGLGENADVKAHFFGFGIGAVLGALTRFLPKTLSRPAWQASQILAAYILYTLAWALAART
jgi:rhomboid protease GluP